ncbi:MAG: RNA pseudouridine synthase [Oscillospiraceae bacterium]|nr:RNA pseudouridine synthase [Oscillospiraceae bacterium]
MKIIRETENLIVCIKPAGVLSTDEPGGMPSLVRDALGHPEAEIRTVHRLDRVVGGLMVLAKSKPAASLLSEQIMSRSFEKEYLAVIHGCPANEAGTFTDLLIRDRYERMTRVADCPGKGVQEAVLDFSVLQKTDDLSLVRICLGTGRTHQIRVQFSSRGMPIVGDKKYGFAEESCDIALWSFRLAFSEPFTGERMDFSLSPPNQYPWDEFHI